MVCACACTVQIQVSVHRNTHVTVNLPPAEPCSDKVICILELKEDAESLMSEFSNVFVFDGCFFFFFCSHTQRLIKLAYDSYTCSYTFLFIKLQILYQREMF